MIPRTLAAVVALSLPAVPALAGDPAAGATAFNMCQTCHVVQDASGTILAGRNGRQGPNLYGVVGRQAGVVDGFRYGASIVQAGAAGLVWDEESFVGYLKNPNVFLREFLNDRRARGNMAFQVPNAATASDLYAFLAQFGAVEPEEAESDAEANPPAGG